MERHPYSYGDIRRNCIRRYSDTEIREKTKIRGHELRAFDHGVSPRLYWLYAMNRGRRLRGVGLECRAGRISTTLVLPVAIMAMNGPTG